MWHNKEWIIKSQMFHFYIILVANLHDAWESYLKWDQLQNIKYIASYIKLLDPKQVTNCQALQLESFAS